jgi:hypothetical protein
VGPAETVTRTPASVGGVSAATIASMISGGSGSRPGPTTPHASSPAPGSKTVYRSSAARGVDVGPHQRVIQHLGVHGRTEEHRRAAGHDRGRQQIVGQPMPDLPDQVRGGGRQHDEIHALPEIGVDDARRAVRSPQRAPDRGLADHLERQLADEFSARIRKHHTHVRAGLAEPSHQLRRLVRRDATPDPQQEPPTVQKSHAPVIALRRGASNSRFPLAPRPRFPILARRRADVAQSVEQLIRNQQVDGSSPFIGSSDSKGLRLRP